MRPPLMTLALAAAVGTTLVGCGGSDGPACDPQATVQVKALDELKFDAESYDATAGCVKLIYTNEGSVAHTLLIEGVSDFKLSIGDTDRGALELDPGTYVLYCDLSGHRAAGMEADLTVT